MKKYTEFIAHTREDGEKQSLIDHLEGTASLAEVFASEFGSGDWGKGLGMLHDIGKYSQEFQERIRFQTQKVDHSTAGAQEASKLSPYGKIASYCIAGHHSGLPNGGNKIDTQQEPTLYARLKRKDLPCYEDYKNELFVKNSEYMSKTANLNPLYTVEDIVKAFGRPRITPLANPQFSVSFFIRMLYSCLVDADFLDTEKFMSKGEVQRDGYDTLNRLRERLDVHISQWWDAKNELNQKRCDILKNCIEAGKREKGLFTLTVPTGGGKTVSSLAFALHHAAEQKNKIKRIIYVIPYTSIIEQTANVFREILGEENVLEHHANIVYDEDEKDVDTRLAKQKLATENWDAPVIVTTNVQFFESFFSNKSSKCRKLHNVANSSIIFDEAQMLPLPYLLPCTAAISELVSNYGCTAVLCTATQPSLGKLFEYVAPNLKCQEICPDTEKLYQFFRRTSFQDLGACSKDAIVEKIGREDQVLCIVNTRKFAQAIYKDLPKDGVFHLSTLMYPKHRRQVLDEVRNHLKNGQVCRVIATSLIEAGVDVDFPVVYREKAGLDSEIQAAGRCNREKKRPCEDSIVFLFSAEEEYSKNQPYSLRQPLEIASVTEEKFEDIASPQAIQFYFDLLHQIKEDELDKKAVLSAFEKGLCGSEMPFEEVAKMVHLIEQDTKVVFIPEPSEEEAIQLEYRLRSKERTRTLFRKIGMYSVNIYENHFKELQKLGRVDVLDEGVAILNDMESYEKKTGLQILLDEGRGVFI